MYKYQPTYAGFEVLILFEYPLTKRLLRETLLGWVAPARASRIVFITDTLKPLFKTHVTSGKVQQDSGMRKNQREESYVESEIGLQSIWIVLSPHPCHVHDRFEASRLGVDRVSLSSQGSRSFPGQSQRSGGQVDSD